MPLDVLTGTCCAAPDQELGLPREDKLTWRATLPAGEPRGVVIVLPGFGASADPGYTAKVAAHAAEAHGLVGLDVDYHCRYARPGQPGVRVAFDAEAFFIAAGWASLLKIDVAGCTDATQVLARLQNSGLDLTRLRHRPTIRGTILPPHGHYQNFGPLAAGDVLRATADLLARLNLDTTRVIAAGTSHGGYLAHTLHRLAPTLLAGIIDNSSYTSPPPCYLGLGPEVTAEDRGVPLALNVLTHWQHERPAEPTFFGPAARAARDLADPAGVAAAAEARGDAAPLQVRSYHSVADALASADDKRRQAAALKAAGADVALRMIDQGDLDGRAFKTLAHGMDASLKALLDLALPTIHDAAGTGHAAAGLPAARKAA